ncbi:MAG TPA: TIR domain-containing protein [Pyrinomonadaceae bacterium]
MWLGAKFTSLSDFLFLLLFRFVFRYDIFISYARRDGKEYALKLRDQLKHLDFSCFLDLDELPAGNSLNKTLKRAIRKSATLVVVGTECAIKSRYVELELGEFSKTGRAIIPIDMEGTLAETSWSILKERDLVWIDEAKSALSKGIPSPAVADSIDKVFKYTRRNSRVRMQILSTILLFVVVVGLSILLIQRQVKAATLASAEAERQKTEAKNQKKAADEATEKAGIAESNANQATSRAAAADQAAKDAAIEAQKQAGIAVANAERAKKQQEIAEERTNYLHAQQMGVQADIDIDKGTDLERSTLLSVESLERALTPDASIAWARGMELLPHAQQVKSTSQQDGITSIAYSRDGRFFATGTVNGTLTFFPRNRKGEAVTRQLGVDEIVGSITFGNDWVGVAYEEGFKIWDLNTFAELRSSKTPEKFTGMGSRAFSPDGRYLAMGDSSGSRLVVVDTITSGTVIDTTLKDLGYAMCVEFSPDGKWLALGTNYMPQDAPDVNSLWNRARGRVLFLDVANFEKGAEAAVVPVATFTLDEVIDQVTFGPLGRHLATEDIRGSVSVWELSDVDGQIGLTRLRSQKTNIRGRGTGIIGTAMFSPDESYIATLPGDNTARIWEVSSGNEVARIFHKEITIGHYIPSIEIAFSPDGEFASSRWNVTFWKTEFGGEARRLSFDEKTADVGASAIAISPGGEWLATINKDGIRVFGTSDWSQVARLAKVDDAEQLTFSRDGRWLVVTGRSSVTVIETGRWNARVLPPQSVRPQSSDLYLDQDPIQLAAGFSPDGHWFIKAFDMVVRLFEVGTWKEHTIITRSPLSKVVISADSQRLAVWVAKRRNRHLNSQDEVFLWETATAKPITCVDDERFEPANLPGQPADFLRAAVCSNVQGVSKRSSLSQVAKWKAPLEYNLIPDTSPNGLWSLKAGAINSQDGLQLHFNEGKTARQVTTLTQRVYPRRWTFTPNSRWVVVAEDEMIRLWPLTTADMIDVACARLRRRDLADDEWHFSDKKLHPCSRRITRTPERQSSLMSKR